MKMMKGNGCNFRMQLLGFLVVFSLLLFLSSFISLTHHDNVFKNVKHKLFEGSVHILSKKPETKVSPDPISHVIPGGKEETKEIKQVTDSTDSIIKLNFEKRKSSRCLVNFQPKCAIHPLIHYWDDDTDCFESPLRRLNGLTAKNEDQKFIVFQPDLGGWNNIRMALEVVILFALVTGRILVFPPDAVLYLLILNKKWGENKSNMDDYFDFSRLSAFNGLEVMQMKDFLETIAKPGLLSQPLPKGDVNLIRKPLWDYLEKACYVRPWSPGKIFIGFNVTEAAAPSFIGDFSSVDPKRIEEFSLKKVRSLLPYDVIFHQQRALFFPGHEENRLLTHFYSYLFFATSQEDHRMKRYMRDRLRYHDEIFCVASQFIFKLLALQELPASGEADTITKRNDKLKEMNEYFKGRMEPADLPINYYETLDDSSSSSSSSSSSKGENLLKLKPKYIAFHIRRGDFQQKHTRLPAEQILELTKHLIPQPHKEKILYISTDEKNLSFFQPFRDEYRAIYFLDDLSANTGIDKINQNYIGMIEQIICAGADIFIGTPLSTFTAYITRMRGYLNRTIEIPVYKKNGREGEKEFIYQLDRRGIYDKTYYFMKSHMYHLQQKPKVHFPLWVRDFVDVFQDIDDYN